MSANFKSQAEKFIKLKSIEPFNHLYFDIADVVILEVGSDGSVYVELNGMFRRWYNADFVKSFPATKSQAKESKGHWMPYRMREML
ncbi:hypothetical protein BIY26_09395 [Brenneria goodwinii]|uniref:Uncharacterized protein n=1 Tax=Brenneria goodwinii TaxID=1109412 RepID=A0AAE8EQD5_9GAMM|nr:hypothetical protein [Brenneria goodwinii]ATA23514.1 hypothetical protein AWC36_05015 [Brenneria goodwinii]RLM25223.1 hypothetical protein BIY26_09395 [Brenneria goodwinii]